MPIILKSTLAGLAIAVLAVSALAQSPRTLSIQGLLTDDTAVPIDGTQTLIVKLFDDSTSGTELWSRTYSDHQVAGGIFSVSLEGGSPDFSGLVFDDTMWVEVRAGAEVITPRTQLAASPSTLGLSLPIEATAEVPGVGVPAFQVRNTATPDGIGILGLASGEWGIGVRGWADGASTSPSIGVWGETNSTGGYGVYGSAAMGGTGVNGAALGDSGTGVRGLGTDHGGYFGGEIGLFVAATENAGDDIVLGGTLLTNGNGIVRSDPDYPNADMKFHANRDFVIDLDDDNSGGDADFFIRDNTNGIIFQVDVGGDVFADGIMVHSSDRNKKEGIVPVDTRLTLERLAQLPISRWRFKGRDDVHAGPMAQDFYEAFDLGVDNTHIATIDADGVALAAIQGLYDIVKEQQTQIAELREQLVSLSTRSDPAER